MFDHPGLAERRAAKEAQRRGGLSKLRPGRLFLVDQKDLVSTDIVGTELVGRLMEVSRKVTDAAHVGTNRVR